MQGVITTKSLIEYRSIIVNEYGIKLYVKCWYRIVNYKISRPKNKNKALTFLSVVMEEM